MVAMLISKNVNEKEFPLLGTELYFIAKKKKQTSKQTILSTTNMAAVISN